MSQWRTLARVGAILLTGVSASPAVRASTLQDEINGLLDSHPQIQSGRNSVKGSKEAIDSARAGYLPQVRVTSDYGATHVNGSDRETTYGQAFNRAGEQAGIVVTQRLYDGDLTNASVDTAIKTADLSEATLRSTRQQVILEGITAYVDVLRQNALVSLARENEKRVQTQLNLEDERVKRGSGMAVDVLSAKHRLQVAKERRVAYEGALEQALSRYQQVFGHAPDTTSAVEPQPPLDLLPPTLEDAVKAAREENPSVVVARGNVAVSGERTHVAEAGNYPTVDLVGRSSWQSYKDGVDGLRREYTMLVQLNWELFSGFRTQSQIAQASYDYAASKDTSRQADRKAEESVRLAWSQLSTAKERLSLLENAVTLATEVFEARKKMREAGKETVIDVLDAESDITNAQINYVVASYDLRMAAYQVIYAIGRLETDQLDRRMPPTGPSGKQG